MNWIKLIHVSTAIITGAGLLFRGIAVQRNWPIMQAKWIKIAPHVVDSALLLSAIGLCIQLSLYPIQQNWLNAKILALLAYIVLGTFALKRAKTQRGKLIALLFAMVCYFYIVGVAVNHNSWSFFTA